MKKLFIVLLIAAFLVPAAFAGDSFSITTKAGCIKTFDGGNAKFLTTFEIFKTKAVSSWPKWANAAIDGWSIDAGFSPDAGRVEDGALMIGRKFGPLADYVPFFEFPLLNKISITAYPYGYSFENMLNDCHAKPAWGGAIIKAEIKFG